MGAYARQHASALAMLKRKGTAVTFTKSSPSYTATTGTVGAPATSTIDGYAVKLRSNPLVYEALGLVGLNATTLEFAATNYGDAPSLGALVNFGGYMQTVKSVESVAPDGTAIVSRVVVAR